MIVASYFNTLAQQTVQQDLSVSTSAYFGGRVGGNFFLMT